jgi:excisionase family DNA binding protein
MPDAMRVGLFFCPNDVGKLSRKEVNDGNPGKPNQQEVTMTTLADYYTVQEVADRLKVADNTILRYIKAGKLKAYRVGKGYRTTPEFLNQFLRQTWQT